MGTRNLIIVIKNQEVKIAQYGNSSGYPEVVGLDILNFISIERNLTELTNRLSKICFMSENDEKLYRSLENKMYEGKYVNGKRVGNWKFFEDNKVIKEVKAIKFSKELIKYEQRYTEKVSKTFEQVKKEQEKGK